MLRGQLGTGRGNNVTDPLSSKERTTHWNLWDVLRNRAEDAHRAGNRGLAATLYQAAEELESSNLKTERMRTELQLQWERDESQRAEVEQLRTLLRIARDEWYDDNGQWGDGFGLKHWTRKADALLSDESSFRETEQHRE